MRRAHRKRAQLPPCYYEGFLEKRSLRNRTSRKLWAALCGDALFFFNNSKDCDYVEKQELSNFVSLTDDPSLDRKLDAARLQLRLKEDDIYLTAPSLEACELWKGFILSVVKLQVPTSLNLLPGQVHMLTEVVAKEKERLKEIAEKAAATPDTNHNMPACFYKLARIEAETFLEKHKDKGNMLLRPSRDGTCFAVTTRQELNGPVFQHYRVTRIPDGGFAIAVTNPITCKTLHDVINYLIETTGGTYKPLVLQHTYEENIVYVDYDEKNGEKTMRCASSSPVRPKLAPKPAPGKKDQYKSIYQNSFEEDNNLIDVDKCAPPPLLPRTPAQHLKPRLSPPYLPKGPGAFTNWPGLKQKPFWKSTKIKETCCSDLAEMEPVLLSLLGRSSTGKALLPPNSRPRSATAVAEAKPRWPIPAVPIGEALFQFLNKELQQKMKEIKVTAK